MRETDGRKQTQVEQEIHRRQAARLLRAGRKPKQVAEALGRSRSWAFSVQKTLREDGENALKAKPRPEGPKKLSRKQHAELAVLIEDHTPMDYGFDQALWTRRIVGDLIYDRWGVDLSEPTVGAVLHELGFSPQRPLREAFEQDPEAVERWQREEFPEIRARARKEGAELYFGDEAGVRSDYHSGTTWAPVGQTPVIKTTGSRKSVSMLSAISPEGKISFEVREGTVDSEVFIGFCNRLLADAGGKKVFLILDNAGYHTSNKTRQFAAGTDGKLTLFFLPTYSPELNPDELVWKNVKHERIGRSSVKDAGDLHSRAAAALEDLRDTPEIIRSMFRAPRLSYIHW